MGVGCLILAIPSWIQIPIALFLVNCGDVMGRSALV